MVFIGMKCHLDDTCYDLLSVGNDVAISYGVYLACQEGGLHSYRNNYANRYLLQDNQRKGRVAFNKICSHFYDLEVVV